MADKKKGGVTRRNFVKGAVAGLGGVAALGFPSIVKAQKKITWRFQATYPSTVEAGKFGTTWCKAITEITNGELTVNFSEPGAIVPVSETFQNVADGTVDATVFFGTSYRGIIPETDVEVGLPFAWETPTEVCDAYYKRGLIEEIRKIYAEHDILFCTPSICNIFYGFHTTKPVRKSSDLKGMKIRDMGISAEWLAHFGAAPTFLPAGEMYMALKMKTLDGVHYGIKVAEDQKLGEVCKYFILEPNPGTTVMNLFCSMKSFNKLPDDIKRIVKDYSANIIMPVTVHWDEKGIIPYLTKKYGMEFIHWPKDDADKARAYMIEKLWPKVAAKSARCKRLVDLVTTQAKYYGKI